MGKPGRWALAEALGEHLAAVCDALDESTQSRSEPDVIIAWPELLIVVEAKTGSPNEILKGTARAKIEPLHPSG